MFGLSSVGGVSYVTEWRGAAVINLGSVPTNNDLVAMNGAGQGVGFGGNGAVEWSGGSVINLGGLPGFSGASFALGINDLGQAVGYSVVGDAEIATEWIGGSVIALAGLPGATITEAEGINEAGVAVGQSIVDGVAHAVEWSGGSVIDLGAEESAAWAINNVGQAVGVRSGGATEWSGGKVINLGDLSGSLVSLPLSISDRGQAVGWSDVGGEIATEWSGGSVINLGGLPGFTESIAYSINNAGQAVGYSSIPPRPIPEPSTWAMTLVGFAGLGFAGYRRAREQRDA